ncbi:hypothetical protein VNO77_37681 [Canavalia gladiata]|uniref:Uncharacterized protein n=1 Tax=Canavalia gladiata TaxID=3824 RepID=A0AAN9PYL2_CANGL
MFIFAWLLPREVEYHHTGSFCIGPYLREGPLITTHVPGFGTSVSKVYEKVKAILSGATTLPASEDISWLLLSYPFWMQPYMRFSFMTEATNLASNQPSHELCPNAFRPEVTGVNSFLFGWSDYVQGRRGFNGWPWSLDIQGPLYCLSWSLCLWAWYMQVGSLCGITKSPLSSAANSVAYEPRQPRSLERIGQNFSYDELQRFMEQSGSRIRQMNLQGAYFLLGSRTITRVLIYLLTCAQLREGEAREVQLLFQYSGRAWAETIVSEFLPAEERSIMTSPESSFRFRNPSPPKNAPFALKKKSPSLLHWVAYL